MKREQYDRLLNVAEHADFSDADRRRFIGEAEELADRPGGLVVAMYAMKLRLRGMPDGAGAEAAYLRESIRLLHDMV